MAVNNLRGTNIEYDFVVVSRYDIAFVPKPGIVQKIQNAFRSCKSDECGNRIIVSDYNKDLNNPSMSDLVVFGTKEGVVALSENLARNRY